MYNFYSEFENKKYNSVYIEYTYIDREYPISVAPEFIPRCQWGSYCSIFSFLCSVL